MKLTEAAWTSIRISSLAGIGSMISPMRRCSGPVNALQRTALIAVLRVGGAARDMFAAVGGDGPLSRRGFKAELVLTERARSLEHRRHHNPSDGDMLGKRDGLANGA